MGLRPGCSGLCPERKLVSPAKWRWTLGYSPAPLLLGLPKWGRDLVVLGYAQRGNWSPQRSGGGHTSIASHGYCGCSNASYGGRCPVGQRPNSTKVEGRCLSDGWRLPRPWKFPGPHGGDGESRGGLTPEREGWAPGRQEIPGREMLNWSGRAGPISTSMGVSPCTAAEWDDWPGRAE